MVEGLSSKFKAPGLVTSTRKIKEDRSLGYRVTKQRLGFIKENKPLSVLNQAVCSRGGSEQSSKIHILLC